MDTYGTAENLFDVKGRHAIITGGTKGLGKAIAACLVENGCHLLLVSRKTDDVNDIRELARHKGVECFMYSCDLTNPEDVVNMADYARQTFGRVEILINCAGVSKLAHITEYDDDDWHRVIDTNISGTFYSIREVSKIMKKQMYGKIINLSSVKGFLGVREGYIAYCTSKGGINMLTKQAACELAKYGITCNAIAPTYIKTDINAEMLENKDFRKSLEDRIPMGRIGEKKDLMGLLLLLASDASSFITGQIILLDGGLTAAQ